MSRLPFIDWVRGFAVVAMVLWHTGDAWLSPGLRDGQGWSFLRFVGGLAAPSFLFLAGVSAGLVARTHPDDAARNKAVRGSVGRGLEVVLIGYLLRYQTWMIDASAIRQPFMARAFVPIGLGYWLLVRSTDSLADDPRKALKLAVPGIVACVVGFLQVESVASGRLPRLLQVDVLQAIGMSLVLLAVLERLFGVLQKPGVLIALGACVAIATEPVAKFLPGVLPVPIAAYFGKWPALPGQPAAALFPLLPWFAYACIGASVGWLLRTRRDQSERLVLMFAVGGALLALATSEAHPGIQHLFNAHGWVVHPLRIAYRVGIVLTLFLVGFVWTGPSSRGRVLLDFGKTSLRVYWAHMLFAYGVLGRPLQKKSGYGTWLIWVALLLVAMWGLAQIGRQSRPAAPARV